MKGNTAKQASNISRTSEKKMSSETPVCDTHDVILKKDPSFQSVEIQTSFIESNYIVENHTNEKLQPENEGSLPLVHNLDAAWKDRVEPFQNDKSDTTEGNDGADNKVTDNDLHLSLEFERESTDSVKSGRSINSVRSDVSENLLTDREGVKRREEIQRIENKHESDSRGKRSQSDRSDRTITSVHEKELPLSARSGRSNDSRESRQSRRSGMEGFEAAMPDTERSDRSKTSERSVKSTRSNKSRVVDEHQKPDEGCKSNRSDRSKGDNSRLYSKGEMLRSAERSPRSSRSVKSDKSEDGRSAGKLSRQDEMVRKPLSLINYKFSFFCCCLFQNY